MNANAPDENDSANGVDPDNAKIAFASPLIAFGVLLVALIPFFLWTGRGEWFEHDDWDYLVLRKAGDFGDLVRPHNGHWETIPVLVYRMLWAMFGLTYRPFQFVSIILSLIGAALFLVVLLRARTRPWIALIFATLLVLFAPAQTNVALKVTSITFVGFAVPLGLTQLLLADHDGPRNRRDWFGLAAGLAAVLCSSVALAMVFVVGVAMMFKRGWRIALFHVLPPTIAFSVWFAAIGHKDLGAGQPARLRPLPAAVHFASVLVTGTFEAFTRSRGIGGVLVIVFLAGLCVVLRRASAERRRQAAVPVALLLGAFVFAVETGIGRSDLLAQGESAVRAGHYLDVVAYLTLPSVAFLAEEIVRRWRLVAPALVALFVVAVPLNVHELVSQEDARAPRLALFRNTVLLIPRLALAHEVPASAVPFKGVASPVTVGWLLHAAREGRLPEPHVTDVNTAVATLRISLVIAGGPVTSCHQWRRPVVRQLDQGTPFRFRGSGIQVGYLSGDKVIATVTYATSNLLTAWQVSDVGGPLTLRFSRVASGLPVPMVCA
ncbi:MAG: hypothetical protein ACLPVY_10685 [Acidimicrobiia bacterium]